MITSTIKYTHLEYIPFKKRTQEIRNKNASAWNIIPEVAFSKPEVGK